MAGLLAVFAQANYGPPERLTGMNPCISKQTCHECIQTPHCAWCAAPVSLRHNFILNIYLFSYVFYTDNSWLLVKILSEIYYFAEIFGKKVLSSEY